MTEQEPIGLVKHYKPGDEKKVINPLQYEYLLLPEAYSRYKATVGFTKKFFRRNFSSLDIGCGNGAFFGQLPQSCQDRYIGIDPDQMMIEFCQNRFPSWKTQFLNNDALSALKEFNETDREFDLVFLCGVLFHSLKSTGNKENDLETLLKSTQILSEHGLIAIVTPFVYSRGEYSMDKQKTRREDATDQLLLSLFSRSTRRLRKLHRSVVPQVGLGTKARKQEVVPYWYTPHESEFDEYRGTDMAVSTTIIEVA